MTCTAIRRHRVVCLVLGCGYQGSAATFESAKLIPLDHDAYAHADLSPIRPEQIRQTTLKEYIRLERRKRV